MDVFYLRLHQILGSNDKITRIAFKDNDKLFVKVVKKVFDIRHIAGVDYHEETRKVKERNIESVLKLLKMVSMPTKNIKAKHVLDADIKLNDLIKELVSYYMNRKIREYKIVTNEDQPVDNFRMWINKILVPDFDISSFVSDFKNPLVFGAILDKVEPGLWKDWRALTVVNKESTVDVMMKLAEDRLNIKPIIKTRDIIGDKADEMTIVIYLSQFLELKDHLMHHFIPKLPAEKCDGRVSVSLRNESRVIGSRSSESYAPESRYRSQPAPSEEMSVIKPRFNESRVIGSRSSESYAPESRYRSQPAPSQGMSVIKTRFNESRVIGSRSSESYAPEKTSTLRLPKSHSQPTLLPLQSIEEVFPLDECYTLETSGSSIGLGQRPWNAYRKVKSQHNPSSQPKFTKIRGRSLDSGCCEENLEAVPFENPSNEEEFWQILSKHGVKYHDELRNSVRNGPLEIGKTANLGKGRFGSIYKGRFTHPDDGFKMCAVQTIEKPGATLKDVQDFLSEAWITKSCNHDNVIRLLNLTFCDGLPYLLFPFYKNGDLASYIKNNELDVDELINFALGVTNGAKYLNDHGYVHRLLTAEGCWVTDKKTVVLSNFELCRDILHGMYMKISSGKRVPCRSAALEILKGGRKFDITTDIWSLGVLLWQIFSGGKTPYEEVEDSGQLIKHLEDGRRLPTFDLGSMIDKSLYELLIKCWNENPSCRPSHDEILHVLNRETENDFARIT